jgi:uncharacterized protein YdeI (BOF family)
MKKILFLFVALIAAFTVSSCIEVVEDAAKVSLQDAKDSLNGVIGDPTNITATFQVPVNLMNDVTAVWSSNNPGVITFAAPVSGLATATVNRPAFGEPDAVVTLTAVLMIESAASATEFLSDEFIIQVTVKANTVEEIVIETVADMLAIRDLAYDRTIEVVISDLTVIGIGNDGAFAYDGTGTTQLYGANFAALQVGKVYTVTGTPDWYFGLWELVNWTAVEQVGATPQYPTQETITDVEGYIADLVADDQDSFSSQNAEAGSFEPIYAKVTGLVYVIPGDTGNYNTYLLNSDFVVGTDTFTTGTTGVPAKGLMAYYNTQNFADLRLYDGIPVTIDVIIHTYRSNNNAFAFYYVGGDDGIEASLTDANAIKIDSDALKIDFNIFENKTLNLITSGINGTSIAWTSDNEAVINPQTGVVTVPSDGQVTVKLTATVTLGSETPVIKEFTVKVGVSTVISIADALEVKAGEIAVVQGYVTLNVDGSNFLLQDETGAIDLYLSGSSELKDAILDAVLSGDVIEVVGKRGAFRGLEQLSNLTSVSVVPESEIDFPVIADVTKLDQLTGLVSQLVRLRNLEVVSIGYDNFGNLDITALLGTETVVIRWDSRTKDPAGLPTELVAGDIINVVAGVYFSNSPQLRIDSESDVSLPSMTIADALDEPTDTVVTVEGYITTNVDGNNFFIQDGTGAIDIFAGGGTSPNKDALLRAYEGRYAVQITAKRGAFRGLEQLSTITNLVIIEKIGVAFPTPVTITSVADLSSYIAQNVRLEGLEFVSLLVDDQYGNLDLEFKLGTETVEIRWDSRTGDPVGFPLTLVAGDIVDVVVGVYWSDGAVLRIDSEGDVTLPPMTIASALAESLDTVVTVRGYVTLNVDGNNFLFQDDTGAIDVFLGSGPSAEKDAFLEAYHGGYAIEIQAKRGVFRGFEQVSSVEFVNIISSPTFDFPIATDVTSMDVTALDAYKAQLVEFKGLEVISLSYDNFGNLDIEVTNGVATFDIRWDSRTGDPFGLPTELVAGDIINVVAGAYWSDELRLRIASDNAIEKVVVLEETPAGSDLFISEYIEGSSFNKAVEIFNGTGADVDLSGYSIALYSNGSATASSTLALTGTLLNGEVLVIYHGSSVDAIKAVGDTMNSTLANFNGDDAVALLKNGELLDVFGVIGVDPGSSWAVGSDTTADHTLVRKGTVTGPTTTWNVEEWIAYDKDTFSYLGSHTID